MTSTPADENRSDAGPRFTVVLNTYQRADRLGAAVDGILAQTWTDFEVVVADDGSTDDTEAVARAFADPRLRYVRQDNAGLSAARNLGASAARGRYVTWVDDDDDVTPDWLAAFASAIDAHEATRPDPADSPAVVCAGAAFLDENGVLVEERRPGDLGAALDHRVGLFVAGSFAVRRDVLAQVGGFDEELRCSHQTELSLRLVPWCTAHDLAVVSAPRVTLRINRPPASARGRNEPSRLLACTRRILDRHGPLLRRDARLYASYCSIAGVCCARLGDWAQARSWFVRAARAHPLDLRHLARAATATVPPAARRAWPGP